MSYEYVDPEDDKKVLNVCRQFPDQSVGIWVSDGPSAFVDSKDAPRIALEILKAAGFGKQELANEIGVDYAAIKLQQHVDQLALVAELDAKQRRRDELANEFAPRDDALKPNWYSNISPGLQSAIDRIIALESKEETE